MPKEPQDRNININTTAGIVASAINSTGNFDIRQKDCRDAVIELFNELLEEVEEK